MTHQQYIDDYQTFADNAVDTHKPLADQSMQSGTIDRMTSYIKDFDKKMQDLNSVLVDKANSFLKEAGNDTSIDTSKLKNDLFNIGKSSVQKFISKYKPQ